ncbi:microtubule organization protein AKNA isoform X2 [Hemicordylus capensis]|uniref:microtubule organization protein AKNA isoform X2 n=1 Tax=Hemicordylus capensis TaxID=884348 RepID=UPI00230462B5|nr:microtubule organization protein AKNA isoform X2 [Hemicordylus capensis]
MARKPGDGFGWRRRTQKEAEAAAAEEEEDDELEGCAGTNGILDVGEHGLVGSVDPWDLSSSQDILEDISLLEELKDYQHLLAEGEQSLDLGELQDLECVGEASPGSPQPDGENREDCGSSEDVRPVSYWHRQREQQMGMKEDGQDQGSSEELEKPGDISGAGSEGEAYPELSYEGQYGSEYSASPEAQGDPLACYKHGKSCNFTSEGEEDFSEHSHSSPSPSRLPAEHTRLKIDVFETRSLLGSSMEYPEEMEFSSPSGRSPESHTLSSPVGSTRWSQNLLDRLSLEDLQDSPGIDAETFPESSCTEYLGEPLGAVAMTPSPLTRTKPKERPWGAAEVTEMPHAPVRVGNRPPERARKLKADVPRGLPSKFSRQSRSLSPRGRAVGRKADRPSSTEPSQAGRLAPVPSDTSRYGRGQLNYPLPDLSRVEPRVRFPRDPPSYHPPRGKTLPAKAKESVRPVVFKSPAEIVREVLLSSGEGSPQKCPTPTVSVIPEELKSPRQATELVHQLQEDYHKLLTKYAEAENTIDRLRLGAKVRLYADPPKPSREMQRGALPRGSKVLTFSIPQVRAAEVTGSSGPAPVAAWNEGLSGEQMTSSSLPNSVATGVSRADGPNSIAQPFSGDHLTRVLAAQVRKFQTQVESLEELIWTGRLTPQDQLKGFARLKEAQAALERAYLQAREQSRQVQNHLESAEVLGDFDPDRVVEGEIFRLEMRLEELKERLDPALQNQLVAQSNSEEARSPGCLPSQASAAQMRSPTPSIQAPTPALRTPYPEAPIPKDSRYQVCVDAEVSSVSSESEADGEGIPDPLRHKQLQVEEDFDHLLDHYSSFKSLPEAMSLEQLQPDKRHLSPEDVDGPTAGDAGTKDSSRRMAANMNGTARISSSQQPRERQPPDLPPRKRRPPASRLSGLPSVEVEESVPRGSAENKRASTAVPKPTSRRQQEPLSPQSSMASIAGSIASERAGQKSFRKTSPALPEELRIVSPETDSGFVGSEASRVSPLAQVPKYHSSHIRSRGMQGKYALTADAAPTAVLQPASRRKEPVEVEPLATDTLSRNGPAEGTVERHGPPGDRGPLQAASPPRWTESIASEVEPDTESTRSDSDMHGGLGTFKSPPNEARCSPPSSSAPSLSAAQALCYSFLDSRLERDQAIAALQNEVSQLRQSLAETLYRPHSPPRLSSSPRTSRARLPFQDSARFRKSANPKSKTLGESRLGPEDPAVTIEPERWRRKASLSQDGTQLEITPSESDCSLPKPWGGKRPVASTSQTKPPDQPIVQGPYTGTRYPLSTPRAQEPKAREASASCPYCQEVRLWPSEESASPRGARETEGFASARGSSRPPQHSTQRKTEPCFLCKGSRHAKGQVVHEAGPRTENALPPDSEAPPEPRKQQQPPQRPGLWCWAVPSVGYVPAIPLAPYPPPPVIYCSPSAPTSTSTPAGLPVYDSGRQQAPELKTWASWRQTRGHGSCSLTLNCRGLLDLNWSLSRAVEAAQGMKLTTRKMSRSLASELSKAKSLRGSCLF